MVRKEFPNAKLIRNSQNLGFSRANNQAIQVSHGRYLLLLNSDTELGIGVLGHMVKFMNENEDAGAATCRLLLPNGNLDPACHRGFPTPWAAITYFIGLEKLFPRSSLFGQYHLRFCDMEQIHEIDSPSGAFFFVRREALEGAGLLDESFFMYGEDLDWAYRIKNTGWKILFDPTVEVLHRKKQSGRAHENGEIRKETNKHFYQAMELFYRKHYREKYGWLLSSIILFVITVKIKHTSL